MSSEGRSYPSWAVLLVLVALLSLISCTGTPEAEIVETPDTASAEVEPTEAPAEPTAEEPIQIAFFAPQANTYVAATYQGIQDVAEREGAEVTFFDTGFDATKEYNQIQDAITQEKFDAFIIIPLDQVLLVPVVEEAIAAGIEIVNTDLVLGPDPETYEPQVEGQAGTVLIPASDRAKYRFEQVVETCKDLDPCNVGWIGTIATVDYEKQIVAGLETLEAENPNIHVVSYQDTGGFDAEPAIGVAQDMLLANPEINVLSTSGEQLMFGAEQAVQEAGRDDIRLISQGASCPGMEAVGEGRWYGTTIDAPYTEGEVGAELAIQAVRGELDGPTGVHAAEAADSGPLFWQDNVDTYECQWEG